KELEVVAESGVARRVMVDMGAPIFDPRRIPMAVKEGEEKDHVLLVDSRMLQLRGVSMGNPHAVYFTDDDPDDFPLEDIGPLVERDPLFPRRVNFEVARVRSDHLVEARVWERGAGITLACGTGACAVFAVARRKGLVDDRAVLALPGGHLEMREGDDMHIYMTGAAALVYTGEWSDD
ncbi:MAG TPA: diaminopimelate epimerase, partial [Chloroflexota bacterium]|nr:diaminopimelate epimerase [Chloroflexota bacterium]